MLALGIVLNVLMLIGIAALWRWAWSGGSEIAEEDGVPLLFF